MEGKEQKKIIAFVMTASGNAVPNIRAYEKELGTQFHILLIADKKVAVSPTAEQSDEVLKIDFSKPEKISEALHPYEDRLFAITCLGDANIARFIKLIPNVPYLRTPTTESLRWATDKYEMRKRFKAYNPHITPAYTLVKMNSKLERARIVERIGFPLIIKPTNLGGSLFVQICYHEEDLEKALSTAFRKIRKAYEKDNRMEEPKVLAEQFMEGDMYSIDSYIDSRGKVYHCPLVRIKTGREIGHQDFFGYTQTTPSVLKRSTVERAEEVTEDAIHALGLRSTSVHVELMKLDTEWKVIEVNPRIGGARDILYDLSCDIKHTLNDILIRIPKKPIIPKKCKGYATYMKWFARREGRIIEMQGIKKIEQLESFHKIVVNKKVGDRNVFASNGGRSVFNLFLYNEDRSKLLADIRRVEQLVKIKVQAKQNGGGRKAGVTLPESAASVKKTSTKQVVAKPKKVTKKTNG